MTPVLNFWPPQPGRGTGDFSYGTVSGDWCVFAQGSRCGDELLPAPTLCINMVQNEQPGNGEFAAFMQQIEAYCQALQYDLMFLNVYAFLSRHLIEKHGYLKQPSTDHCRKSLVRQG